MPELLTNIIVVKLFTISDCVFEVVKQRQRKNVEFRKNASKCFKCN